MGLTDFPISGIPEISGNLASVHFIPFVPNHKCLDFLLANLPTTLTSLFYTPTVVKHIQKCKRRKLLDNASMRACVRACVSVCVCVSVSVCVCVCVYVCV